MNHLSSSSSKEIDIDAVLEEFEFIDAIGDVSTPQVDECEEFEILERGIIRSSLIVYYYQEPFVN